VLTGRRAASGCESAVVAIPDGGITATYSGDTTAPKLSPDGTHVAVSDSYTMAYAPSSTPTPTTYLFANGNYVAAVSGQARGWTDDAHLLAQTFLPEDVHLNSVLYDGDGGTLYTWTGLTSLSQFQPVNATHVLNNSSLGVAGVYDITTGALVWSEDGVVPPAVFAGPYVVAPGTQSGGPIYGVFLVPYP
jgi:hypothetical protein